MKKSKISILNNNIVAKFEEFSIIKLLTKVTVS